MKTSEKSVGFEGGRLWRSQRGASLLAFLTVIVLASSAIVLGSLRGVAQSEITSQGETMAALAEAKAALISYAMMYPNNYAASDASAGPGLLPCPDTDNDGSPNPPCGPAAIGRLPDRILVDVDGDSSDEDVFGLARVRDADGERLWYALDDNFRNNPKLAAGINSETPASVSLDGTSDIVALIIAPGGPLEDASLDQEDRDANPNDIDNYLEDDNATTGDNSYVSYAAGTFNDRVIAITRAELMAAVEKRVMAEVSSMLIHYGDQYGVDTDAVPPVPDDRGDTIPWLSPFAKPNEETLVGVAGTGSGTTTLVDASFDFIELGVRVGDVVAVNRTGDDYSIGVIDSVAADTLTVTELRGGTTDNFQVGDDYRIARFNGVVGVTEGLIPYHEPSDSIAMPTAPDEPFRSELVLDWNLQNGDTGVDNGITVSTTSGVLPGYAAALERFVETTATSGSVPVAFEDGFCLWTAGGSAGVKCVGRFTMSYFDGIATAGGTAQLQDSALHFDEWGVQSGALVENLDDPGGGGDPAWGIVDNVADTTLQLASTLQGGTKNRFDSGDRYRVRVATRSTPTATPEVATAFSTGSQLVGTFGLDYQFDGVEVGDVVYNLTEDVYGVVTGFPGPLANMLTADGMDFEEDDEYIIYFDYVAERSYEFEFDFAGTNNGAFGFSGIKRRSVCSNDGALEIGGVDCFVSGSATSGSAGLTLEDSVGGFPISVRVGDVIENTGDNSTGIIETLGSSTLTVSSLSGGTSNAWQTGDGYRIHLTENLNDDPGADSDNDDLALITIRDVDSGGGSVGTASAEVPASGSAYGSIYAQRIQTDFEVGNDMPLWFVQNGWHRLIYVAASSEALPGTEGVCSPVDDEKYCLTLTGKSPDDDKEVLVVAAGDALAGQDRSGVPSTCGAIEPSFFCDYFEGENADFDFDDSIPPPPPTFDSAPATPTFNDQVRIVGE